MTNSSCVDKTTNSCYHSAKSSKIHEALSDLVIENKKFATDGAEHLEHQIRSVHAAILQLKDEIHAQRTAEKDKPIVSPEPAVAHEYEATAESTANVAAISSVSSKSMEGLSKELSGLAREATRTIYEMILDSLWFSSMNWRVESVKSSHEKTFCWALDPFAETKLETWLRTQSGIYWVMGKAGSGKSTLMKYLIQHPRTAGALQEWAGTNILVTASFFFWNAGTAMQKSQEGLYRSLLYEILRQRPELIPITCAPRILNTWKLGREMEPWTRQELWQAIGVLGQQRESPSTIRFCFFIDGLDEYDGDPDDIIEILEKLRSWPDLKICVSSRPWNEFTEAQMGTFDPTFALEDLTRIDIRNYVRDTLEESARFRALTSRDPRSHELTQEIVDKARGVFLWVILVVKSLLAGLRNADKISHLQHRLREFPETLESYFDHILNSVDKGYGKQTAQTFTYALEAEGPLSLLTYSFLEDDDVGNTVNLETTTKTLTMEDIVLRHEDTQRRLNAWCKGLLEVVAYKDEPKSLSDRYFHKILTPKVDFLHRTVRDFLLTKTIQIKLAENLQTGFEPKNRLCIAFHDQMKILDYSVRPSLFSSSRDLLEDFLFYAYRYELAFGTPQVALIDDLGQFVSKPNHLISQIEYIRLLVQRKLYLYVTEALSRQGYLPSPTRTAMLISIVVPSTTKYFPNEYDLTMIKILLEHGATPNGTHNGTTAWTELLLFLRKSSDAGGKYALSVVDLMLQYGADPDLKVVIGKQKLFQRDAKRASEVYANWIGTTNETKLAREILEQELGPETARGLLNKSRQPRRRNWLSRLMSRSPVR